MQPDSDLHRELPTSYTVRVDHSGRIVIPSSLRTRFHFEPGDELVLREEAGAVTINSYDHILAEAQAYFRSLAEPGVSMVDELLAERHVEAAREAAEDAGSDE